MLELLFFPFLIFEGLASGLAHSLGLAPPPTPITELVRGQGGMPELRGPEQFLKGAPTPPESPRTPILTYENEERWDITWSDEGLPTRVIVHRQAKEE